MLRQRERRLLQQLYFVLQRPIAPALLYCAMLALNKSTAYIRISSNKPVKQDDQIMVSVASCVQLPQTSPARHHRVCSKNDICYSLKTSANSQLKQSMHSVNNFDTKIIMTGIAAAEKTMSFVYGRTTTTTTTLMSRVVWPHIGNRESCLWCLGLWCNSTRFLWSMANIYNRTRRQNSWLRVFYKQVQRQVQTSL